MIRQKEAMDTSSPAAMRRWLSMGFIGMVLIVTSTIVTLNVRYKGNNLFNQEFQNATRPCKLGDVDGTLKERLLEFKNTSALATKIIQLKSNNLATAMDYTKKRTHTATISFHTQDDPDTYFDLDKAKESLARDRVKPRRVIAMTLFGDEIDYMTGAVENAIIVQREWDESWRLRVYFDQTVPPKWIELLHILDVELHFVDREGPRDHSYQFWRFFVLEDPDVTRFIVRDSDARVSLRDRSCVEDWIKSDQLFHTIHDHKFHGTEILAGMWGSVGGLLRPKIMTEWRASYEHGLFNEAYEHGLFDADQIFLKEIVWPHVQPYTLGHSAFLCDKFVGAETRAIPVKRDGLFDYVGVAYRLKEGNFGGMFPINFACPVSCRPKDHQDWTYC